MFHDVTPPRRALLRRSLCALACIALVGLALGGRTAQTADDDGKQIFRFDTFGNETFWTDTLRLHEVIAKAVDPTTALSVGLKVDSDALPPGILKTADLKSPATTVALLKLNAVVGVKGTVVSEGGQGHPHPSRHHLRAVPLHRGRLGDARDRQAAGRRPNLTLNPGAIIALSPALDAAKKAVYNSWGPGKYDPRFNHDGKNAPVLIPPAFGLASVKHATYTGDGDISYWNHYVGSPRWAARATFKEPKLGIDVKPKGADLVKSKLPALKKYQHSLANPAPKPGSFDAAAAKRGADVFTGGRQVLDLPLGRSLQDEKLHDPAETGMDPGLRRAQRHQEVPHDAAARVSWRHPPYFHDGKAADLPAVVEHYKSALKLNLTADQAKDLVEYLKSL